MLDWTTWILIGFVVVTALVGLVGALSLRSGRVEVCEARRGAVAGFGKFAVGESSSDVLARRGDDGFGVFSFFASVAMVSVGVTVFGALVGGVDGLVEALPFLHEWKSFLIVAGNVWSEACVDFGVAFAELSSWFEALGDL